MYSIELTSAGMYRAAGGFHIDPWEAVELAVQTHAHSDHMAAGCAKYITSAAGERLLQLRAS